MKASLLLDMVGGTLFFGKKRKDRTSCAKKTGRLGTLSVVILFLKETFEFAKPLTYSVWRYGGVPQTKRNHHWSDFQKHQKIDPSLVQA